MAQLKDTKIEGILEIQGKDENGKSLILPEGSKIYIGNSEFTGGESGSNLSFDSPVFTSSISMGRIEDSEIGVSSVALGENLQAIGDSAFAEGYNTISGGKGFKVLSRNGLVEEVDEHTFVGEYVLDSTDGLEIGDTYSIRLQNNYDYEGTIYSILTDTNAIRVTNYIDEEIDSNREVILWIPEKPTIGTTKLGQGSHAEGYQTRALCYGSHAEGCNTEAGGRYSHAEGNSTKAGYAAHAEGVDTKASGSKSHAEGYGTTASGNQSHAEGQNTTALGKSSHAEGFGTTASNHASHAEGYSTTASGYQSHAEGYGTTASGEQSHAEGQYTTAEGNNSHAEGAATTAEGNNSHAEGVATTASGDGSHAEGAATTASGDAAHAEGAEYLLTTENGIDIGGSTSAFGQASHAEGAGTCAKADGAHSEGIVTIAGRYYESNQDTKNQLIEEAKRLGLIEKNVTPSNIKVEELESKLMGYGAHAEGFATQALGSSSHAEGNFTEALANSTHAEGDTTVACGEASHAEGHKTNAAGNQSHAEGFQTMAIGNSSHAEGKESKAKGYTAHAEGLNTKANGRASHSEGTETIAASPNQHAQGKFNIIDTPGKYAHIVGNGENNTNRSNAHTLDLRGNAWYQGSMTSNGADYAEFFEWQDGNPDNEDRVGLLVALDGEKIRLANAGDEMLGIISGTAAVLGDNYECEWNGKYLTDDFGRVIYDLVEEFIDEEHIEFKEVEKEIIDEETNETRIEIELEEVITTEKKSIGFWKHPRINPDYNPEQKYVNRSDRPEWDAVGMLGKLYVRDNGTCIPNFYATVGENGIATSSLEKTNMRVLSRVNDNVVRVLLK